MIAFVSFQTEPVRRELRASIRPHSNSLLHYLQQWVGGLPDSQGQFLLSFLDLFACFFPLFDCFTVLLCLLMRPWRILALTRFSWLFLVSIGPLDLAPLGPLGHSRPLFGLSWASFGSLLSLLEHAQVLSCKEIALG